MCVTSAHVSLALTPPNCKGGWEVKSSLFPGENGMGLGEYMEVIVTVPMETISKETAVQWQAPSLEKTHSLSNSLREV